MKKDEIDLGSSLHGQLESNLENADVKNLSRSINLSESYPEDLNSRSSREQIKSLEFGKHGFTGFKSFQYLKGDSYYRTDTTVCLFF